MSRVSSAMGVNANDPGRAGLILAWLLPALILGASFLLHGKVGINIPDEGFLWYGVGQVLEGAVPLRDFQSYEPGRYYWCAIWAALLDDGLVTLRLACAAFAAVGLGFGLLVTRRVVDHTAWLVPAALVNALWIFTWYKAFESALSLVGVWAGVRLVERPGARNHFVAGLVVGLMAFFGRNIALYSGLGIGLLVVAMAWKSRDRLGARLVALVGGGLLGSAPLWGMLLLVSGFAEAWWQSVVFFLERGTNHPLATPWPWYPDYAALTWSAGAAQLGLGLGFVYLWTVPLIGVAVAFATRLEGLERRGVLIAAAAIGLFWAHHASVRSDAPHLAESLQPALLAGFALPRALGVQARSLLAAGGVLGLTVLTSLVAPFHNEAVMTRWTTPLAPLQVGPDELRVRPYMARSIKRIRTVIGEQVPADASIFVAPIMPGYYPLLGKTAPVWRLYFLWKAGFEEEAEMIRTLVEKDVRWALIGMVSIDARPDLLFRNSHPRVWRFLQEDFQRKRDRRMPPGNLLFERKN